MSRSRFTHRQLVRGAAMEQMLAETDGTTEQVEPPTPAKQALKAISEHLAQGDWGNAERVLNAYAKDHAANCNTPGGAA